MNADVCFRIPAHAVAKNTRSAAKARREEEDQERAAIEFEIFNGELLRHA